ncbi:MAG: hypothetical protein ABSH50_16670 [Bryobacteraceae bacterium]|jgi:hypothetical protein
MSLKQLNLALAAICVGVAAHQPAPAQTAPTGCTKFHKSVTVTITSTGTVAKVKPDPSCVAIGGKMNWKISGGEKWATDFDADDHSPFPPGKRHHEGVAGQSVGDTVRACSNNDPSYDHAAGGCVFKYKASHVKGGTTSVLDPQVVVQPGT